MHSEYKNINLDTIIGKTTEGVDVMVKEFFTHAVDVCGWLRAKLTSGAFSDVFIDQLALSACRIPLSFGPRCFLVDIHAIYDQIGRLEYTHIHRAAKTKGAKVFKKEPLKGLWHQHWFQASFLSKNLILENERCGELLIKDRFGTNDAAALSGEREVGTNEAGLVAHAMTIDAFVNRVKRSKSGTQGCFTGEWVVFAKMPDRNIYLTLATHDEDEKEVLRRCVVGVRQFPELNELAVFKSLADGEN
ncbi:MAG: hypothetical protein H8E30_08215 [Alphaproteobacteria bacterium]|nr:hypothetical protein [Alphaproteobacteria bacterium]